MKPLAFVLLVIALHLSVAAMAASRHAFSLSASLPLSDCDAAR